MTLSSSILGSRLDALVQPVGDEAAAAEAIADAFADYFIGGNPPNPVNGAIAGAVPVIAAAIKTTAAGTPWAPSTPYLVGAQVGNAGNIYACTIAGTSAPSGGPTGTGGAIVDGTVTWAFSGAAPATNPKAAMKAALSGMNASGQGATKLASSISQFWSTLGAPATMYFSGATAITPPAGLAGLAATLVSVFASNTSGSLSKTAALNNVATAIHAANAGGIATFPTPVGPQTIS